MPKHRPEPMTTAHHREIAHRLCDPRMIELANLIFKSTGSSSRASKQASRLIDAAMKLRCELEAVIARDHPTADHTGIYWPPYA